MASKQADSRNLRGVIDMGSNGIRFSITNLSSPTTRVLPTVFQDRCGISLYNNQYQNGVQIPLPDQVIDEVVGELRNFKRTAEDFGVQSEDVQLIATEATRNAINSSDFIQRIEQETGWQPRILSKEDEGRLGAMGIASSMDGVVDGLVMDMGGGSVQLTWMEKNESGNVDLTCFRSYPYGAAALTAQLPHISVPGEVNTLTKSVSTDLQSYLEELWRSKPAALQKVTAEGLSIYLSGGGFRSWGHILMSAAKVQPYPIPIVNGFVVDGKHLLPDLAEHNPTEESHRISSRRDSQVPAIQFLLKAVLKAFGNISITKATFCQGGVREGLLYGSLSEAVRSQNALAVASTPFAPRSTSSLAALLSSALPSHGQHRPLIPAIVNLLYYYDAHLKDVRTAAALRSTTTGILANTHGISHNDRTVLALVLCERWGGEDNVPLSDRKFLSSLEELQEPTGLWWARYLGYMANGIARIYPSGIVRKPLVTVSADGANNLKITITPLSRDILGVAQHWAKQVKKMGKRKHRVDYGKTHLGKDMDVNVDLDHLSDI